MTIDAPIEALYATGHWLLTSERFADAATVFRTMALATPKDERVWLALGACHEGIGQLQIASALYEIGASMAAPAVRCSIARARALRALGRDDEADLALEDANGSAVDSGDEDLVSLVLAESRGAA